MNTPEPVERAESPVSAPAPVLDFAEDILSARTALELGRLRTRLQHLRGILDTERASLTDALDRRELELISYYTGGRG